MRALGNYLLSSRWHAMCLVSLSAVVSFYLSSIFVALAVMRRGGKFGIQIIAGSMVAVVLAIASIRQAAVLEVLLNVIQAWLPVWCCAMVLRKTESQAAMTLLAGAFGAIFVVLFYVLVDDVPVWWQTWFNDLLNVVIAGDVSGEAAARIEQLRADVVRIAPMINPLVISFLVIRLITVVLIGRWWQAKLFNPGGFRTEFYALRLPRFLLYFAVLALAVLLLGDAARMMPARDLLWLLVIVYLFQGLSSVHRLVRGRDLSSVWLVAMYGLLVILFPHMIVFVACIGMADSWTRGKKAAVG